MIQYLITDPKYYTSNPTTFKQVLTNSLNTHNIDIACFRDKHSSNFKQLASIFIEVCKEFKIKHILLNTHYKLAYDLGATGVHLTSLQYDDIKYAKKLQLFIIVSCHTKNDIQKLEDKDINMVTYSPIFNTPNKGEAKGIVHLHNIASNTTIPIIALGGIITKEHINQIKTTNSIGFASIRYFI